MPKVRRDRQRRGHTLWSVRSKPRRHSEQRNERDCPTNGDPFSYESDETLALELLITLPVTMVPLYFGIVTLAVWGPFPRSFDSEARVFAAGIATLLGGLIISANLVGSSWGRKRTRREQRMWSTPCLLQPSPVQMLGFFQGRFLTRNRPTNSLGRGVTLH